MASGSDILEYLALGAAGIAIYLVVENNAPSIKKVVSSVHSTIANTLTPPSTVFPVSTTISRDERPPPSRGTCPPGMYPDYTLGILHCHSSGGTRELNPNVKLLNSQWQNAWGLEDGWVDNQPITPETYPSDIKKTYDPHSQKKRQSGRQQDISAIEDQGIPKSIAKTVLPPTKKQIQKTEKGEKKRHLTPVPVHTLLPHQQVTTQVQCPKDLDKITCDSLCWKNDKLYKITCREESKKKKPSIIIPHNFPSAVTVTPGGGDEPYPSEENQGVETQQPSEATQPDIPIPPLQLTPGQQPITPSIPPGAPGQAPTPSAPAPQLKPIPSGPAVPVGQSSGGGCNTKDGYPSCRFAIGCECDGKRSSEDGGQDGQPVSKLIGNSTSFYAVWDFHTGGWSSGGKGGGDGAEVTDAYCGSNSKFKEVGITIGVSHDGKIKTRTEDHYSGGGHQSIWTLIQVLESRVFQDFLLTILLLYGVQIKVVMM